MLLFYNVYKHDRKEEKKKKSNQIFVYFPCRWVFNNFSGTQTIFLFFCLLKISTYTEYYRYRIYWTDRVDYFIVIYLLLRAVDRRTGWRGWKLRKFVKLEKNKIRLYN